MRIVLVVTILATLALFTTSSCSRAEENYKLATSRKVERLVQDIRAYISTTGSTPKSINELIESGQDISYLDEGDGADITAYRIRKVSYEDGALSYVEVVADSPDAPRGNIRVSWATSPEHPYIYGYAGETGPVSIRYEQRPLPDTIDASEN